MPDQLHHIIHCIVSRTVNLCPVLTAPTNGQVSQNGNNLSALANYSCNERFRLVPQGAEFRTCTANGWNGALPMCGKYSNSWNGTLCVVSIIIMTGMGYVAVYKWVEWDCTNVQWLEFIKIAGMGIYTYVCLIRI